jgi:CheY-like chemotaxis protein
VHGEDVWDFLARLKREDTTAQIPVIIASTIDDRQKGFALGADAYGVKPIDRGWLLETLESVCPPAGALRVLSVDDEEAAQFIIREMLNDRQFEIIQAASGQEALRRLDEARPDVVLLDFRLTDMTGFDVYEGLRRSPAGAKVPVVMVTSQRLTETDRRRLGDSAVLPKDKLTRDALVSAIQTAVSSS